MEDWFTPTKLLKDRQQIMLGMREDLILFHHLMIGKLRLAQTNNAIEKLGLSGLHKNTPHEDALHATFATQVNP